MKKLILFLAWLSASSAFGLYQKFPSLPTGCFDKDIYCSQTEVLDISDKKNIRITFFATAKKAEYPDAQAVVDKYFAFERWKEYASDSDFIEVVTSVLLRADTDSKEVVQYSHLINDAPFPIRHARVREVTRYLKLQAIEGADLSYSFDLVLGEFKDLPEEKEKYRTLQGAEGLVKKQGEIHVRYDLDSDRYVMVIQADIVPSISLMPNVAAKYIEKSFVAISKGMLTH